MPIDRLEFGWGSIPVTNPRAITGRSASTAGTRVAISLRLTALRAPPSCSAMRSLVSLVSGCARRKRIADAIHHQQPVQRRL
ncbi:Uncharacterised protein [Mycobacterium tuberculosis]|nr:Uncharacterised protein [Mycobacterium tuberculosis]